MLSEDSAHVGAIGLALDMTRPHSTPNQAVAQQLFVTAAENGDIYLDTYSGACVYL